jgi:hypothetical protein
MMLIKGFCCINSISPFRVYATKTKHSRQKSFHLNPCIIKSEFIRFSKGGKQHPIRTVWGQGGEMNQALYAHMNNKRKMKKKRTVISSKSKSRVSGCPVHLDFCIFLEFCDLI